MLDASSTINYSAGQIRANNAIIALGAAGDVQVFCGQGFGTADLIIDVNGYFPVATRSSRRSSKWSRLRAGNSLSARRSVK